VFLLKLFLKTIIIQTLFCFQQTKNGTEAIRPETVENINNRSSLYENKTLSAQKQTVFENETNLNKNFQSLGAHKLLNNSISLKNNETSSFNKSAKSENNLIFQQVKDSFKNGDKNLSEILYAKKNYVNLKNNQSISIFNSSSIDSNTLKNNASLKFNNSFENRNVSIIPQVKKSDTNNIKNLTKHFLVEKNYVKTNQSVLNINNSFVQPNTSKAISFNDSVKSEKSLIIEPYKASSNNLFKAKDNVNVNLFIKPVASKDNLSKNHSIIRKGQNSFHNLSQSINSSKSNDIFNVKANYSSSETNEHLSKIEDLKKYVNFSLSKEFDLKNNASLKKTHEQFDFKDKVSLHLNETKIEKNYKLSQKQKHSISELLIKKNDTVALKKNDTKFEVVNNSSSETINFKQNGLIRNETNRNHSFSLTSQALSPLKSKKKFESVKIKNNTLFVGEKPVNKNLVDQKRQQDNVIDSKNKQHLNDSLFWLEVKKISNFSETVKSERNRFNKHLFQKITSKLTMPIDCGDKLCHLEYHVVKLCTIYLHTNSSSCQIPCLMDGYLL